jgi:predicted DNA-binding transcriptional regulator AlpA
MRSSDDTLIAIAEIRAIFKLGRTAAYELTHRPDFPAVVRVSPRCYRWWASEVETFAEGLRSRPAEHRSTASPGWAGSRQQTPGPVVEPRHITGRVRSARARRGS